MSRNKDIKKWAEEPELPIESLEGADPQELRRIRQNRSIDSALIQTFNHLKTKQDEQIAEQYDRTRFENLLNSHLAKEASVQNSDNRKQAEKYALNANADQGGGLLGFLFGENRTIAWGALGAVFVVMSAVFYFTGPFDPSKMESQEAVATAEAEDTLDNASASEVAEETSESAELTEQPEKTKQSAPVYGSEGPGLAEEEQPPEPGEEVAIAEIEVETRSVQPQNQTENSGTYSNQALSASKEAELKMAVLRAKSDADKKAALIRLRDYYQSNNRQSDAQRVQNRIDSINP